MGSVYCTWPFVAAERNRLTLSMCSAEQRIHCLKECLCIEPRSTLKEFYNNLFQATRLVSQYPSSFKAGVFHLQHLLYRGQFSQLRPVSASQRSTSLVGAADAWTSTCRFRPA